MISVVTKVFSKFNNIPGIIIIAYVLSKLISKDEIAKIYEKADFIK